MATKQELEEQNAKLLDQLEKAATYIEALEEQIGRFENRIVIAMRAVELWAISAEITARLDESDSEEGMNLMARLVEIDDELDGLTVDLLMPDLTN